MSLRDAAGTIIIYACVAVALVVLIVFALVSLITPPPPVSSFGPAVSNVEVETVIPTPIPATMLPTPTPTDEWGKHPLSSSYSSNPSTSKPTPTNYTELAERMGVNESDTWFQTCVVLRAPCPMPRNPYEK